MVLQAVIYSIKTTTKMSMNPRSRRTGRIRVQNKQVGKSSARAERVRLSVRCPHKRVRVRSEGANTVEPRAERVFIRLFCSERIL